MKKTFSRTFKDFNKTYINGELAIKPYYYVRNNLLHVRYTVDRAIRLTDTEADSIKKTLSEGRPENKQATLSNYWNLFEHNVEKPIINDGITEVDNFIDKYFKE